MLVLEKQEKKCQHRSYVDNKITVHKYGLKGDNFRPQYDIILYKFDYKSNAEKRYEEFHGGYGYLYMTNSSKKAKEPIWSVAYPIFVDRDSDKTWDFYIPRLEEFEILKSGTSLYAFSLEENYDKDRFLSLVEDFLDDKLEAVKKECEKKISLVVDAIDDVKALKSEVR